MSKFVNDALFLSTTSGLVDFGIGIPIPGYQTPASAGAIDAQVYSYSSRNTDQFESGTGPYDAINQKIIRQTVLDSSAGFGVKVDFTSTPIINLTVLAQDLRELVTADRTYYIRKDGSDSNNGLTNNAGGAFLTIQKAINTVIFAITIVNCNITIQIGDGTYDENLFISDYQGIVASIGGVVIVGNISTPDNVVLAPTTSGGSNFAAISYSSTNIWTLGAFRVTGAAAAGPLGFLDLFAMMEGSVLQIGSFFIPGLTFGEAPGGGAWFDVYGKSFVGIFGECHSDGQAATMWFGFPGSQLFFAEEITFDSDPAWGFAAVAPLGDTILSSYEFNGTVTGRRFNARSGAVIVVEDDPLPGSVAGIVDSTSYYNGSQGTVALSGDPTVSDLPVNSSRVFKTSGHNPILFANVGGTVEPITRERLTADTTFYVATTGSDSTGDGTSGNPWATPQHAWDVVADQMDLAGHFVNIQFANGTYVGVQICSNPVGAALPKAPLSPDDAQVRFLGNASDNTAVVFTPADPGNFMAPFFIGAPNFSCGIALIKITLQDTIDNLCVDLEVPSFVYINHCRMVGSAGTFAQLFINRFGLVVLESPTFVGPAFTAMLAYDGGYIDLFGTITVSGTPNYAGGFASATGNGVLFFEFYSITGSATGPKYVLKQGSKLITDNNSVSSFPGSTDGTVDRSSSVNGAFGFNATIPSTSTLPTNTSQVFKPTGLNPVLYANVAGTVERMTREVLEADRTYYVALFALGSLAGGSGYVDGVYGYTNNSNVFTGISMTGGSGTGAKAIVTVAAGAVTIVIPTNTGSGYQIGDVLSASAASLGGSGSGFAVTITGIGSDTANGLGAATSFRTIQRAVDTVCEQIDCNGHKPTIFVADGVYAEEVILRDYLGGSGYDGGNENPCEMEGSITADSLGFPGTYKQPRAWIVGANPAVQHRIIQVSSVMPWRIDGFRIEPKVGSGFPDGIEVHTGARLSVGLLEFGNGQLGGDCFWIPEQCSVDFEEGAWINFSGGGDGNWNNLIDAYDGAKIHFWEHTHISFTGDMQFNNQFINAGEHALVEIRRLQELNLNGHTITGRKYYVWQGGKFFYSLNTGGVQPPWTLPGDVAGVVEDFGEINGVQICTNRNGAPNVQTNDYTLQFTDGNTDLFLNKATPLTLTLPKEMPLGWECWLHQEGVGAVPFATASGATLEGETGLTTQYSAIHLVVRSNADGVSAAYRASGAGSALIEDTIANILAMTPTLGSQAYATDLGQTLVADGSSWNIDSSYYTALSGDPDIGLVQWSNRIGYGKDYVTDKVLANCSIGYGSNSGEEGDFRYSASTHVLQIYSQGAWKQINIGVPLRLSTVDQQLESETSGGQWLRYFGDSEILGLNGLPIVQGGHVSMGAYPVQQVISGGTF